jgi:hypothetical protein
MTPGGPVAEGDGSPASATPTPATRRLALGDPLDTRASEDRPESWGDPGESEDDVLAHYRTQKPPHHGS